MASAAGEALDISNPQSLARATPETLGEAIEKRNQLMDKIRDAAIKATFSEQWCDMDGKPWPTASAAETIARRCGVKVHSTRWERVDREDDQGPFYFYVYTGTVELPGGLDSAEVLGTCSSRDQFLGTETREGRDLSEINEDDIMKAAYSNMLVNGVMRLLGIRGLTWERLEGWGVKQDGAARITHNAGAKGGGQSHQADDVEIKWGNCKGKLLSQCEDKDVAFYLGAWRKDLTDASKEKYHPSCKRNIAIAEALQAKRANEKAGAAPAQGSQASGEKPSMWARLRALDKEIPEADLKALTKRVTGKASAAGLTEEDLAKVKKAIDEVKASAKDDIPF